MSGKLSASPCSRGYLAPHALQKRKSTPKVVRSSFWSDSTGAQCSASQATTSAPAEIDSPAAHGAHVQACGARTTSAVVSVVASLLITVSAALAASDAPGSHTTAISEAPGASIQSPKSVETSSSLPKEASTSQSEATGAGDVTQVAQNSQEGAPAQQKELFDAMRYVGRWYEIASLKKGFAGEGQEDCHCTQGIYSIREEPASKPGLHLDVSTFCVHGSATGRISGIKGAVTCADPYPLSLLPEFETTLERQEGIFEKCLLRFPAIPFIPPEPYDVLRTDYTSYALVQGAKDRGFVQIYSRTPNPGPEFLAAQMATLKDLGYQVEEIRETPQDCPEVKMDALTSAMATGSTMELTMSNTMPSTVSMNDLTQSPSKSGGGAPKSTASGDGGELKGGAAFAGKRDIFQSIKDLSKLFQSD